MGFIEKREKGTWRINTAPLNKSWWMTVLFVMVVTTLLPFFILCACVYLIRWVYYAIINRTARVQR